MDKFSFIDQGNIDSIENLYSQYENNPGLVDQSWRHFFQGFEFARQLYPDPPAENTDHLDKEFRVLNYIDAFRKRGHLFTTTNPVRTRRKYLPALDPENYGLNEPDLNKVFHAGTEIGLGNSYLKDIISHLQETYCQSIGSEFMFIRNPEKIDWLIKRIESSRNRTVFSEHDRKQIFSHLLKAVGFENFIHKKFTGQKRFSLEGTETLIPALYYLIEKGSDLGVEECFIGMAHRGRLNVLANVLEKPYEKIFQEFVAEEYEDSIALGDVKYHLGYCNQIRLNNGNSIALHLVPNAAHLESVSPITQGITRAKIDHKFGGDVARALPVLIHGDAAIAGQGIVYEVVQMSELSGYKTGGTIHIIINNQVGFTTNYLDARSSTYCTDIGKVIKAPIFHVNGDDVEALVHTVRLAMEYRQVFHTDVFIDILSYRKYGHNEGDEPRYTQPTLYRAIENHPNPRDIYAQMLIGQNIYTSGEIAEKEEEFYDFLEEKLQVSKSMGKVDIQQFLYGDWKKYKHADLADFSRQVPGKLSKKFLQQIARRVNYLPRDKKFIDKTNRLIKNRIKMLLDQKVDWALAELMAYGTLVYEGYPVRLSGQDSIRGTFSHRHASHVIEDTDDAYTPLKYVDKNQASFNIYNSPLNEYGTLGFEYGYALAAPQGLTIWEAQYGDFANVAQVIIDQYISSAEEKWGLMNGIVLFLPHGYEGQGPEHSSARIERFLLLAARNNMQIVNPTTPANMFHILRQSVRRDFRVPLIIFTPKSLLRHPGCISQLDELAEGRFQEVIEDHNVDHEEVRRLVFCTGKIYYDLASRKEELLAKDVAIVRIEQLHPFPLHRVRTVISQFPNLVLTLWVQEEPVNMGAWRHIRHEFRDHEIIPVCRQASGSTATGLTKIHKRSQEEIINKVFRKCVCELKNRYCGLQCPDGSIREQILKEYGYFSEIS
ncbi:MAG: 2-oxoglutarate dehydrogenase E1 component [Bacteroidales bacterium]|nr:2-oxoglutarate dehydrogenase E1 component [Bacteroidales bacterium]